MTVFSHIPLEHKKVPTQELNEDVAKKFNMLVMRQEKVDISLLQQRIQSVGTKLWDPANQKDNVPVRRAGHDTWGIGKVVFIFCDDYLQKVFTFPWFHSWREELVPILKQIDIPLNRIVRCILASMPPGANIPVHHDTGSWVHFTHRLHLPIFTSSNIDFMVGPNDRNLQRYELKQGNLYELNNSCRHSVTNNWNQHRVHLILDYVDNPLILNPIDLKQGTIVWQTRRSVDLSTDYGKRIPPSFIIIGAQKAGTTSLYDYILQHDLVWPAKRKETHYFDWRWNKELPDSMTVEGAEKHFRYYEDTYFEKNILHRFPSLMSGEATPSYILGGKTVIKRMKEVIPHCHKVLVIMRDPVERAYSHYSMTADTEGSEKQKRNRGHHHLEARSFEQIVDDEIEELAKLGVHPNMNPDEFDRTVLRTRLNYDHGAHSFLARGLYALQLASWIEAYGIDNVLLLTLDDFKSVENLYATMDKVFNFLGLPYHRIKDTSAKNTRRYSSIDEAVRVRLAAFYKPYNEKLYALLGRDMGW
ncbi:(heparan sulfate)-glucosamine 3-sulfotransferase 1 [Plasmopara halstedii]|uniref:(Heparan sulfate)-glucosamine 3-sulfotransferase 1 n=1 Tax=Plasmopara halstedii TaxID=4781 RepID=A0A0P1AZF7_PLAHL|nr:(heparan sulfate)-glucosamine 3-sulfotransferase 1 [Plasmopara halstedii]CEG46544.1 (heparan sulfate)-glucosamine 3-sulfotransferase 1 [Plasmopara halstedii]|eukprot:XP_024582913.1 (heparan sulfate)-glucosamine 3-sulfotransferase 1 [Plasmopara halstedii]